MENENREIRVLTHDTNHTFMTMNAFETFISKEINDWSWIKSVDIVFAANDYYENSIVNMLKTVRDFARSSDESTYNLPGFVSADGQLGNFIFDTRRHHGSKAAFITLLIRQDSFKDIEKQTSQIKSTIADLVGTYDYNLALYLTFEQNQSASYIATSNSKKIQDEITSFRVAAINTLTDAQQKSKELQESFSEIASKKTQIETKSKEIQKRRLKRYRKVFETVRNESNLKLRSAHNDLTNAYNTYHAQVDLKSSIVYWGEKATQYNVSKTNWLRTVIAAITLTFVLPVAYYTFGGITQLSKLVHPAPITPTQNSVNGSNQDVQKTQPEPSQAFNLATSITDLTGAALLVALLSVLLRLSLRQYNMCIYLGHDADERVTMLKTYLALSNEGKLTSDADTKLVLDALFRASQSNGVAESTATTPIELIIKAIAGNK